jgi:hypothetical protein
MRYHLRTLLIVLIFAPPILGWAIANGIHIHDAWLRINSSNGPRLVPTGTYPVVGPGLETVVRIEREPLPDSD